MFVNLHFFNSTVQFNALQPASPPTVIALTEHADASNSTLSELSPPSTVRVVADDDANRDLEDAFRAATIDRPTYEAVLRLRAADSTPESEPHEVAKVAKARSKLCQRLRQENEERFVFHMLFILPVIESH